MSDHSNTKPAFIQRFDAIWSKMRRVQTGQAICWTLLIVILGVAMLAAIDYWLEVGWTVRAVGLGTLAFAVLTILSGWIIHAVRRWSRPRTAAEIEQRFPELGQSVRTTVQFGDLEEDEVAAEGVAPTLVTALEQETEEQTKPLGIDVVIPSRRLKAAASIVAVALVLFAGATMLNWEWRVATSRALLSHRPYTELDVSPGDTMVDEGSGLEVSLELKGRTDRTVTLYSRPADQANAEWAEQELPSEDAKETGPRSVTYVATLEKITAPIEYRVVAGPANSKTYKVDVQYPLSIKGMKVELTPPAYTGIETKTVDDGNLNVIDGTKAKFHIKLDREPKTASVVLTELGEFDREGRRKQQTIPLKIDGADLSMELELTSDKSYSILAEATDGTRIPKNSHRIRVRQDQPPTVWFDEPAEALEVHSLAEVLLRIRVRDDFGLTKSGIIFEVNNEEEYPLLAKDFQRAADELKKTRKLSPQTSAVLEKVLPLEYFQLTQKDSVTYYAFAEDNFPGGARRTETDLRFIDIRPFKRTYRILDPQMGDGESLNLASLDELIARQRFALNRCIRLAKRAKHKGQPDLQTVDRLISFESKLAKATRELAEFLEAREIDGNDVLFQAEQLMLAAVDSLGVGKYENATLQEKDALRYLIEARDKVNIALMNQPPQIVQQVRSFSRMQAQKLRRPKDEDEETVENLVARLRKLADDEEFVYETLAGIIMDRPDAGTPADMNQEDPTKAKGSTGTGESGSGQGEPKEDEPKRKGDTKKSEKPAAGSEPKDPNKKATDGNEKSKQDAAGASEDESKTGDRGKGEKKSDRKPAGMSRAEIEKRQIGIALEAHDVERILMNLEGLSELAKRRITDAAKTADAVSGALERGDTKKAMDSAQKGAQMFRELARHVQGLMVPETAQKIAAARDLSGALAQQERQIGEQMRKEAATSRGKKGDGQRASDGTGKSDAGPGPGNPQQMESRARQADRLAESGKTLLDILEAATETNDIEDQDLIWQVEELLKNEKVRVTVSRMEKLPPVIRSGDWREVRVESKEIADRLEIVGQKLATMHRRVVAPRIEELMELEQRTVRLQEKLDELATQQQISAWHRKATDLLDDLEQNSVAAVPRNNLRDSMRDAGQRGTLVVGRWDWGVDGGYYDAPVLYHRYVAAIAEDLQEQIQELIVGDHLANEDEATPPQYEHLVERYYKVLASGMDKK